MIEIENLTDFPLSSTLWNEIATLLTIKEIEVIIMNDEEIQEINCQLRGINTPTDVISQPLSAMPHSPLGTLFISAPYAMRQATRLGHSFDEEMTLYFIHGLLHLLGYDHEKDDGLMRKKEHALVERFGLPSSLIVRSMS